MTDYEFMLEDRISKIRAINEQYDLEHNAYLSFSGGKDSTVLHYLLDIALPNNKIPRLYLNTGIEYQHIRKFVKSLAETDERIVMYNSGVNIKKMLETNGYPFKSKQHSHNWSIYNNNNNIELDKIIKYLTENESERFNYEYIHNLPKGIKTIVKYIFGIREKETPISVVERERESIIDNAIATMTSPECLRYQFTPQFKANGIKLSDKCCYKLKKEVALKWEKENNRYIAITGIRGEEGGMRALNGCTIFDGDRLKKFHPLKVVSEQWEHDFIKAQNIKLCDLYYPPYNFTRTGCKGCGFSLTLEEDLQMMKELLPNEYKQCCILWKPLYDEYKRIGYRLSNKIDQISIFDL